jgi:glucose/arabinose dehydrogenase/type 1 glutamine amidotransferase
MSLAASAVLALGLTAIPAQGETEAPRQASAAAASNPVNVLVFHGPAAEQDDPVQEAAETIQALGASGGFDVDVSTDPSVFSAEGLRPYRGVVFLSAVGAELSNDQERALESYIEAGGGFLGIHDAARAQERSQWFSGLIGARVVGALPDPEPIVEDATTASGDNPPNETRFDLVDGDIGTKWLTFQPPPGWVAVRLQEAAAVNHYAMTSANDAPDRDPQDWILQGSNDGTTWVDLDTRTGEDFPNRFQTREFTFENTTAYEWYRLFITDNSGTTNLIQLAELELFAGDAAPPEDPPVQEATVSFVDRQHPANDGLPFTTTRADQWLNWAANPIGQVHTVAQVNEWTYDPGRGANGAFHPISWCRDYDGGRSFYTGMGATADGYGERIFRDHLRGAIQWTTGMIRGDCQATIASNYRIERLTQPNQPGQLDQIGEPHGLDIAPDGTVFYIGKAACPSGPVVPWEDPNVGLGCGTVHQWDPGTEEVKLLANLPVFGNRGGGDELVKTEEGLVGITLDPNFMQNGWMYLFWMPHDSIDRERHTGDRVISRFTYDHQSATLDLSSRVDLLGWEVQIHSCCHVGGGMDFDDEGNLYVGVGDNNSSGGSSGYSGNNWTQEFAGISFQDARRTAGNTNDLNGKILRIHPEPDGSYTIPDGNLFPESEDPGDKTRPEIYVMGVRNISTLVVDPETDWLNAAWVGPDAGGPSPELGPAKYETATIITSAGNQGWPYCMGNRQPYRDRSNVDASILTGWYDCDNLQNTSPRNTGLVDIPPARDNMIWYSPQGGGPVYPERPDGSGIPTYVADDATFTEPYMFTPGGCRAVMTGPTYHSSQFDVHSGVAWPTYWEDKWFIGDWCDGGPRVAVTLDPDGVEEAQPPLFGEDLSAIIPRGQGSNRLQQWMMDSKFGPDGALYMLDYGGGFFTIGGGAKLIRVVYDGGAPTPGPTASAVAVNNTPMTIAFTGEKSGGVSYRWDFGDGTRSSEVNPRHTYISGGDHTATLTVTYADGETATTQVEVDVSCPEPDDRDTVWLRDIDTGVTNHPLGGGCTINDLIDDERDYPTHGAFVTTVTELANRLRAARVITGAESEQLVDAAADSDIGTPEGEPGYIPLFDGTAESLEDWSQAPSGEFVLQPDGTIRTVGGLGMLWYTERPFADFSLELEFRDVAPGTGTFRSNGGVFVRFPDLRTPVDERPECGRIGIAPDSPAWMAIYCGHEIQINDNPGGDTRKTGSVYLFDDITDLAQARPVPKGQWSDYEIRVVGQHYTIIRDGVVINEFDNTPGQVPPRNPDPPTDLRQFAEGFIGLQNHGGSDVIEYRNVRVREL